MEQEDVELVDPEALELAFGGHVQVGGVVVWPAERGVREAREALRPVALTFVEVVADGADEAEPLAVQAVQRTADERVGLPIP